MDSSAHHKQQNYNQYNSDLVRYRSAPSTLLYDALGDGNGGGSDEEGGIWMQEYHPYSQMSISEKETTVAKFIQLSNGWRNSDVFHVSEDLSVKQEVWESVPLRPHQSSSYAYESQMSYQDQTTACANGNLNGGNGFDGSFNVMDSLISDNSMQPKMGARNCSNLSRQNTSPVEFFNKSTHKNGLAAVRQVGGSRVQDVTNGQSGYSVSRMNGQISFSSRPSSYSSHLPHIAEIENENGILENCNGSRKHKTAGFTYDSWDNSSATGIKPDTDNDGNMFSVSNSIKIQTAEFKNHTHGLSHQFSWPSSSSNMASMYKLLQVQGSVQCKVRAKRGFATHPRSIAERVRRIRISERIKTLEGLFPEIDKQTSTADKLELVVRYIKDLQTKIEMLTAASVNCTCSSEQKQD